MTCTYTRHGGAFVDSSRLVTSNDAGLFVLFNARPRQLRHARLTQPTNWFGIRRPGPEPQPEKSRDTKPCYTLEPFHKWLSIDTSSVYCLAYLTSAMFFRVENAVVFDPQLVTPAGSSWLSIPDSTSIFQTSGPSSHPSQLTHPSQTLITTSPQFINDYSHPIHLPTASLTESPPILTLPIDPLTPPTMFDLPDAKRYAAPPIPSQQPLTNPSQRPTRRPLLLPLLLPRLQPRNRNPQTPNRIRSRPQRPSRPPRRHHPPPSPYF